MKKKFFTIMLGILGINVALDIVQALVYYFLGIVISIDVAFYTSCAILAYIISTKE